jgi:hypothetical protein
MRPLSPSKNPFAVRTPEDIAAAETLRLFVDVFTDFYKIRDEGHCMLNGPRGCGKSMMFRYLMPDCQLLVRRCALHELPFFAVLVSIKNTDLNLTELQRLVDGHANVVLNEHFLTMYVAAKTFATLSKLEFSPTPKNLLATRNLYFEKFLPRLVFAGRTEKTQPFAEPGTVQGWFARMTDVCDQLYRAVIMYLRQISFQTAKSKAYRGPLCGYLDFLHPLLNDLRDLPYMCKGPVYLLMDDADYLNTMQTKVLNSWMSTRTSGSVSIKVSTQLKYKTYQTVGGLTVDSPHDYSEINISDIYTSSRGKYLNRVEEIVHKRLEVAGIKGTPKQFFPVDESQEQQIAAIAKDLRKNWKRSGRGHRPSDDAVRYARPTYITRLLGKRKAGSTYNYAGFEQLVHISSGLIRYFLEPAAQMFTEELARSKTGQITSIRPSIQNEIVRATADSLMFTEYDKIFQEERDHTQDTLHLSRLRDNKVKLHNLIRALGGIFHAKLVSNDAERRVFSVAFSDSPDAEVLDLFNLGIQFGYFHRSTIGNKDGTGRTPLYVLTRRLAPQFGLDPTGFAGYLFVTNERIHEAIANPDRFLRRVKTQGVSNAFEERQLKLFE